MSFSKFDYCMDNFISNIFGPVDQEKYKSNLGFLQHQLYDRLLNDIMPTIDQPLSFPIDIECKK